MRYFLKVLYLSLIFLVGFNFNAFSEKKIIGDMIVEDQVKYGSGTGLYFQPTDKNFNKLLQWTPSYYTDKKFMSYDESAGNPCFRFLRANTYDGNKIALIFKYSGGSGSQSNTCVPELYKISSPQNDTILETSGFDSNGKVDSHLYYGPSLIAIEEYRIFIVIVSNLLTDLCIKQASQSGVVDVCYDFSKAQEFLGKIVQQRINAVKEREIAKGNIVDISEPSNNFEISNKDKIGPNINIPGKLIAKNDQIILSGQITDENQISSVKIDNEPITLDAKGNFEMALYVPYDGLKVSVEAIDKFANKSSRVIVIEREEITQSNNIIKLPNLNPTKVDAKENNKAIALIIGITNYKNIPLAIYADKDAKMFSDFAYRSLGVSRDKIKLLINETANYIEIKKTIKRWLQNEISSGVTDVYVFFAGHGLVSENQKDLFLLPYDSEPSLLEDTSIKRSELFSIISENNPKTITAFFDTCYSGLTRENKMLIASARPLQIIADENTVPVNINLLTAAANNEIANGLDEAEHGMFSYFLMEGLSGNADMDNNKSITLGELHIYLNKKVKDKSIKIGRQQSPQLSGNKDKVLVRLN